MDKGKSVEKTEDIKSRVMGEIKKKKISIDSPSAIFAKKLGLECAMAAGILGGAFLISIFFYVLKKAGVLKFLSLGFPGLRVFLLTVPYGYVALFAGMIILTLYIANKLDLPYKTRTSLGLVFLFLLGSVIAVGLIFILVGVHEYFKELAKGRIPKDISICGRIEGFSNGKLRLEEEDGQMAIIELGEKERDFIMNERRDIMGRYFRAVGERDPKDNHYFHAKNILCCDED